jgi:hypothetical protein
VNFVFRGRTGGQVKGKLTSRLVPGSLTVDGAIYHVTFEWIVKAAKRKSFVVPNGGNLGHDHRQRHHGRRGDQGLGKGAPVHEEGQLIDEATLTFAGEIWIARGCGD